MTPPDIFSTRSLACFVILFALFVCSILPTASAEAVKGSARVLRTEGARVSLLVDGANLDIKTGALLKQGSVILTGSESSVDLLFENGVVLQIQQNSEFSIDKFLLDPFNAEGVNYKSLTNEPTTSVTQLKLDSGTILASSKKLQGGSAFEIVTPVGICGIRGTRFFVQSEKVKNQSSATIGVAEGLVEFVTPKGQKRQVAAGETLGITETESGDSFTPNPPRAAELLPATNQIDSKLRQTVPEKSFEGSEASSIKVPALLDDFVRPFSPEMVKLQGGTLPPESKLAGQKVKPFEIANYEVTWNEWKKVQDWAVQNGYSLKDKGKAEGSIHPVTEVNWYDALKWCNAKSEMNRLEPVYRVKGKVYKTGEFGMEGPDAVTQKIGARGYRLPTDAEWEWAARGGEKSQGYIYAGSNDINAVGWSQENTTGIPLSNGQKPPQGMGIDARNSLPLYPVQPVGQKDPNEVGIYDMSGNVTEWIWDKEYIARNCCSRDPSKWATLNSRWKESRIIKRNYLDCYLGFRLARNAGP